MVKKILGFIAKHSGTILTIAAGAGVVATGVIAHKDTLKAATNDKGIKNYIPSIAVGAATIGTIVGLDILHVRKEKLLIATAAAGELMLETYERKINEKIGPEEAAELRKDVIGEVTGCLCEEIHESFSDNTSKMLCYDAYTKTFFNASQVDLLLAERDINEAISNGGGIRLLDFLSRFNDRSLTWKDPKTLGWYCDDQLYWNGSFYGNYISIIPKIEEHFGRTCLTIYWSHEPWEMEPGFLPLP